MARVLWNINFYVQRSFMRTVKNVLAVILLALFCFLKSGYSAEPSSFFPFVVSYDAPVNATNVAKYLDAPAGKHGFVRVDGDKFVNDAGEIRFWGTNLSGAANFPTHEQSERIAARLAKFGYNCVRLHWIDAWDIFGGWNPKNHTDFDPERVDRLDYLIHCLKKQGIYVNINLHVARWLDDRDGFPHKNLRPEYDKGVGNFYPAMIEKQKEYARMLLTHVNPYTNLAYTEDPAVAMVEISNEDSIILVWMNIWGNLSLDGLPDPYMAELVRQWNDWLKAKYGSTDAMYKAWAMVNKPLGGEILKGRDFASPGWDLQVDDIVDADATVQDGMFRVNVRKMGGVDWVPQLMYRRFTIEEGKPYTLSFRMRSDRANRVYTSVSMDEAPWSVHGVTAPLNLTAEWQEFKFQFFAKETCDAMRFNIVGMTVGWYELDGVTLRSGGNFGFPEECNLEDGTMPYLKRTECERMPNVTRDWIEFLVDIERKYWIGMYRYLKDELGVKAPISGTQLNMGSTHAQAALDYCDNHAYWNHPNWPNKAWDNVDWYVRNRALVNYADTEVLGPLATARVAGKPYTISEYNHPYPNQYGAEGLPMLAAFGRFQHWNGIFQYTYAHTVDTEPDKLTGYFDMNVHATQLVHSPACAAMFKRGLVSPAPAGQWFIPNLWAEREIDILAQKLTPQALNFSGLGRSLNLALHYQTSLNVTEKPLVSFGVTVIPTEAEEGEELDLPERELHWNMDQKDAGYFTVNAPDVKVFTGFVRDRKFEFDGIIMKPGKTSLDHATISLLTLDDGGYLLAATGAMYNTGGEPGKREKVSVWDPDDAITLENRWGDAPVLCEGVPLELTLPKGVWLVYPLDEAGNRRAEPPLRFENAPIRLGPEQKTIWYEIQPVK